MPNLLTKLNTFFALILGCVILVILFMTSATVPVGHVGVVVKTPYLFGESGVTNEVLQPGRHYKFPTTTILEYKVLPENITVQFDDLITKGNMPVDFEVYLQIQIKSDKANILHGKFGHEWFKNNMDKQFQEVVRSHAKKHEAFQLMTDSNVTEEMAKAVKTYIQNYIDTREIPVNVLDVTIGKINPPDEVIKQTIETASQEQKQKTEVQRALAEKSRADAETNKALADKAYMNSFGMNTAEYLHLRTLEIESERIKMIKDKQNVTIIMGNGTPVINSGK